MNQENQDNHNAPAPVDIEGTDLKDTVSWIVKVMLKVGAGYLAKVIIDAIGL